MVQHAARILSAKPLARKAGISARCLGQAFELRTFPCLAPLMPAPAPPLSAAIGLNTEVYAVIALLYKLRKTVVAFA